MCKLNLAAGSLRASLNQRNYYAIFLYITADFAWQSPHCSDINGLIYFTIMPADPKKIQALRASGTLNPRPEKVRDPRFAEGQFFDPHDLVQLKYETLRTVEVDGQPISQAAAGSGLSRPTIYEAQAHLRARGLEGLLPKKRGPKSPHKLKPEVRQYLVESSASEPELNAAELVQRVRRRFGVDVHPRTVEKALKEAKRGRQTRPPNRP
jgi:transposase